MPQKIAGKHVFHHNQNCSIIGYHFIKYLLISYIHQSGTLKWMKNMRKQLDDEDHITLTKWRETIQQMAGAHSEEELQAYVNKLKTSVEASKRDKVFIGDKVVLDKVAMVRDLYYEFCYFQAIFDQYQLLISVKREVDLTNAKAS